MSTLDESASERALDGHSRDDAQQFSSSLLAGAAMRAHSRFWLLSTGARASESARAHTLKSEQTRARVCSVGGDGSGGGATWTAAAALVSTHIFCRDREIGGRIDLADFGLRLFTKFG